METRKLGNSDISITPVGFGAWALGGDWKFGWGRQDDNDSVAAIHRALELGINWIDTAAIYGFGHSEEVVARALAEWPGPRPYVFTKCSMLWNDQGEISCSTKGPSIRREVEQSLRRLNIDVIDLYQIHWSADELAETEEGWAEMVKLRDEGKLRAIGVSNFDPTELEAISKIEVPTSLQPPYSLIRRDVQDEILPYCEKHGIGTIVYSPMGSGLLTGAFTRERAASLPQEDWRSNNENFKEPKLTENLAIAERLKQVAAAHGRTPGEAAIAWTLRLSSVTAAIVGARSPQQVDGFIGAMDFRLTPDEVKFVEG